MPPGPPKRYDSAIAVVTGASSGLGRQFCLDLAARGASVIGLARRAELLETLRAELAAYRSPSRTSVCDVSDHDTFRKILEAIEREFGRVDILINNAGIDIELSAFQPDFEAVQRVFATNFFAVATGTLTVLPGMLERGSGIVVNVSSDTARAPEPRQGAYAASKAAVSNFTDALSHETAPKGVHLHLLYPAWVPTAMGLGEGGSMPPKPVRRRAEQVSTLLMERMGGERVDINASRLPLLAPITRTLVPGIYRRSMKRMATTTPPIPAPEGAVEN
jgi:short-subunit dehydrogenase